MPVRVVHPIVVETLIERVSPLDGSVGKARKAVTRRDLYSLFDELVRATSLIASPNLRFDVLLVRVREARIADGSGSWRRRGVRTLSRDLVEVVSTTRLDNRDDWLSLVPSTLAEPYDSASLGAALGLAPARARKLLYAYGRAGLLAEVGKSGRRKLYAQAP